MGENTAEAPTSSTDVRKPSLIVFDMDYTLWPFHADTNPYPPLRLDKDGKIRDKRNAEFAPYPGVGEFLEELYEKGTNLALASRTEAPPVGRDMIRFLNWTRFFKYMEIYPGRKTTHFNKIRKDSGVEFKDMLFFDDEYRNIRDISALGVTCFYVEEPMSRNLLDKGMEMFAKGHTHNVKTLVCETARNYTDVNWTIANIIKMEPVKTIGSMFADDWYFKKFEPLGNIPYKNYRCPPTRSVGLRVVLKT